MNNHQIQLDEYQIARNPWIVKLCSKCHALKSSTEFSVNRSKPGGFQAFCKHCDAMRKRSPRIKAQQKAYNQSTKYKAYDKKRTKTETYRRKRKLRDARRTPEQRLTARLRSRLWRILQQKTTRPSSLKLLGCSASALKLHLEVQFSPGMTWENWGNGPGTWQVDHIVPFCQVNLQKQEDVQRVTHYTNLQPLWYEQHLQKTTQDRLFRG